MLSATFPRDVRALVSAAMKSNTAVLNVHSQAATPSTLEQSVLVCPARDLGASLKALIDDELQRDANAKIICFFSTVRATQHMAAVLAPCVDAPLVPMHSKLEARMRLKSWLRFQQQTRGVLCTSDVSARGMDYRDVTLVLQCGLPASRQQFIHRLGRTARAGKAGRAVLVLAEQERRFLDDLRVGPVRAMPLCSRVAGHGAACRAGD